MNPYPERIEELHAWLEARYGQRDRQATGILLTALLTEEVTGARKPWFVIETDFPSRDTRSAWFSFGGQIVVRSMSTARAAPHRHRERLLAEWIAPEQRQGLFVDSEWQRLSHLTAGRSHPSTLVSDYALLMSRCLRLRVAYPKGDWATRADREESAAGLYRLLRRVLDDTWREPKMLPGSREAVPAGMLYWCELLQKASKLQTDWDALVAQLAAVARNACTLYNDPARGADWRMSERLIRDSVNWVTAWIMRGAKEGRELMPYDPYAAADSRALSTLWKAEIRRLRMEGVIAPVMKRKRPVPRCFRLGSPDWEKLIDYEASLFAPEARTL